MFGSPWLLLLLLLLPLIGWRLLRRDGQSVVTLSALPMAADLPRTVRQRLVWLPSALTWLALTLLIVAVARPRHGREQTIASEDGIAIELVVDRSSSMQALDFNIDGRPVDRLTAVKNVAAEFVEGTGTLPGRGSDLIGLITFAGYADNQTPLTLDHRFLVQQLFEAQIVNRRQEDGTAIGDALALAVEKLASLDRRQENEIPSKVIILLTDGENTAGEIEPLEAADLAKTLGFRVYTIGVGTQGMAPVPAVNPFTGRQMTQMVRVNIDERTLRQIAARTGGRYFRATDTESLENIYAEIDALEKVEVESRSFVDYREWAVQPLQTRWGTLPPLLLCVLGLLSLRVLLQSTWLRRL
jgi:Ca-activated chloride channel family protein